MKTLSLICIGAALSLQTAFSQSTLLYSWENSTEGWGLLQTNWTSGGFSTATGVTHGSYSWTLMAGTSPDYGGSFGGPASTSLTALLSNASSVSFDINIPTPGDFGWYLQFDLTVNQSGGIGYQSVDGYTYSQSANVGGQKTLTFTLPFSITSGLASNPGLATSLNLQIGGGGAGTMYLDNMVVTTVPEPTAAALAGLGCGLLLALRRKHS